MLGPFDLKTTSFSLGTFSCIFLLISFSPLCVLSLELLLVECWTSWAEFVLLKSLISCFPFIFVSLSERHHQLYLNNPFEFFIYAFMVLHEMFYFPEFPSSLKADFSFFFK